MALYIVIADYRAIALKYDFHTTMLMLNPGLANILVRDKGNGLLNKNERTNLINRNSHYSHPTIFPNGTDLQHKVPTSNIRCCRIFICYFIRCHRIFVMMESILYRYNPWWEDEQSIPGIYPRQSLLDNLKSLMKTRDIIILTGLRRIGKTTVMKLLIDHLINNSGIAPQKIFYISLDDYLLSDKSILELTEEYRKIHKIKFEEKIYLFLDEIAYKNDFELQLKNLYDTQNVKIFAASSQSSVLKSKKSLITGRARTIEILPLDFDEFLQFKEISISKKNSHLYEKYFEEFLFTGGIPEYVIRSDIEYLKEVVDDIIMKDISAQHNIKDSLLLKDFFLLLMERSGKVFSINKLANILKVSPDTIRRYLNYFQETYLVHFLPRHGTTNERILSAKKIYSADLGIRNIFTGFRDKGSLFENYIYLKLKHRSPSYIYRDGIEIDFFTRDKTLVEVKYGAELKGKQSELFDSIKAKEKYLITGFKDLKKVNFSG